MRDLKKYSNQFAQKVTESGDISEQSLKKVIEEFQSTFDFVDTETEAAETFKMTCQNYDGGSDSYINSFGGVHSRQIEKFSVIIEDRCFDVTVYEHYVDPGSVDYLYSIHVSENS